MHDRFIQPAQLFQDNPKVKVRGGEVRRERQRPSDGVDRRIVSTEPVRNHTEEMQAVDVGGIERADLPADALGLGRPA
jgi:hypothetical protein